MAIVEKFRFWVNYCCFCRSQWPRGLRRGSVAARPLGLRVQIPLGAWVSVCCECLGYQVYVSAIGQSLVHRSRTECCVCECDREASVMRRLWRARGSCAVKKKIADFRAILLKDMNQLVTGIGLVLDRCQWNEVYWAYTYVSFTKWSFKYPTLRILLYFWMSCSYGPGIGSRWGEIIPIDPDRPWGPPSLLYNGKKLWCVVVVILIVYVLCV
jgi:hypothetical protein